MVELKIVENRFAQLVSEMKTDVASLVYDLDNKDIVVFFVDKLSRFQALLMETVQISPEKSSQIMAIKEHLRIIQECMQNQDWVRLFDIVNGELSASAGLLDA